MMFAAAALAVLDPASHDPNYWFRFRSWVMSGAARELSRRRLVARLTVGDVLESWARALVPTAALVAALADAEADHHRWVARAEALTLALDEARAQAGAARLAEVDGVLGTLLDLVAVEAGWEMAFESAVGGALGAVMGYYGKCASGTCPLTATPIRGAIYGAVLGALFSLTMAKQ